MLKKQYAPIRFGISLSNPCNIIYHVDVNQEKCQPVTYTTEELERYAQYIEHTLQSVNTERKTHIDIHGMNVLDSLEQLLPFVTKMKDKVDWFSIRIQERLTQNKVNGIMSLWKVLGNKLKVDIQYGFSLEENDNINEYDSFYYNMRWLYSRGLGNCCLVSINPSNAHRITEIFDDFLKFKKEYKDFSCTIFLSPQLQYSDSFDKDIVENALKNISEYINENPELGLKFSYSPDIAFRTKIENSLISNILLEMTVDGNLYPGYNVRMLTDTGIQEFILGNISEEFDVLDERKELLLKELENVSELTDEEKIFRSVPWEDKDYIYNIQPSEQMIILHNLFATYLYDLTASYKEQL